METWKTCSSCKKEIGFQTKHYECSVSTCTGKRTGYVFCSIPCFERHLPGARHRDAGAIESTSPSRISLNNNPASSAPTRRIIPSSSNSSSSSNFPTSSSAKSVSEDEILIVVSKMKSYISERADMNTSGDVAEVLSHFVRRLCDDAIDEARREGRKTVMGRDFSTQKISR